MAYRKKIEYWLENDCKTLPNAELDLVHSSNSGYLWHLTVMTTEFEIEYNDSGYLTLSSLPRKGYLISEVREIYQGDISKESYSTMIGLLADNLTDLWV
jgi:hypothetical protein